MYLYLSLGNRFLSSMAIELREILNTDVSYFTGSINLMLRRYNFLDKYYQITERLVYVLTLPLYNLVFSLTQNQNNVSIRKVNNNKS